MAALTPEQVVFLQGRYRDLTSYGDDPTAPIDEPLTYRDADGDSLLHYAARGGDAEAASLLLAAGMDPNLLGDMSLTPLHCAADQKHREMVELLISYGARADMVDEFGRTPDLSGF